MRELGARDVRLNAHPNQSATMRPIKRSFNIKGHRTSISLEAPFWDALKHAADEQNVTLAKLVETIDNSRQDSGLSSAVRIWLLHYFRRTSPTRRFQGGSRD